MSKAFATLIGTVLFVACVANDKMPNGSRKVSKIDASHLRPEQPKSEPAALPPPPQPVSLPTIDPAKPAAEQATFIYASRCEACHGIAGLAPARGVMPDGMPPPRLSDSQWQRATSDERIAKTIAGGKDASGPTHKQLIQRDLVDNPMVLRELVQVVRRFEAK